MSDIEKIIEERVLMTSEQLVAEAEALVLRLGDALAAYRDRPIAVYRNPNGTISPTPVDFNYEIHLEGLLDHAITRLQRRRLRAKAECEPLFIPQPWNIERSSYGKPAPRN